MRRYWILRSRESTINLLECNDNYENQMSIVEGRMDPDTTG